MKKSLEKILKSTYEACVEQKLLSPAPLPPHVIEVPNNPEHGHYATNLALALASLQRRPPRQIAAILAENIIDPEELLEGVEVAGPGFINFRIRDQRWRKFLVRAVEMGDEFARSDLGKGSKVLIEFVSANPTGPLHLGHGRGAALGDTLCRIMERCGYQVVREFYINDAGRQITLLGESIYSRWRQLNEPNYPFPQEGYHGHYILELAQKISREVDLGALVPQEAIELCAQRGKDIMLQEIKADLGSFGVDFDVWFSETELHRSGLLQETLELLSSRGYLYEKDGALWIKTTEFGDDKDRVVRKQDGGFTYFASDIAYHLHKKKRGFDKAINIWGADHHGYVPRVKAALKAQGIDERWLKVLLIQLVKLWKGGQEVKMSKRAGQYVTLRELLEEVGRDAVRFVFLSKNHDSPLDFDIDLVKKQDPNNPVYYVQYAHARICSIFRKAQEQAMGLPSDPSQVVDRLTLDHELSLIRLMAEYPALLEEICTSLEPHRLTYYLTELASQFHKYFNLGTKDPSCRVVNQDPALTQARLVLAQGVRMVLANGLRLLGVSTPERM